MRAAAAMAVKDEVEDKKGRRITWESNECILLVLLLGRELRYSKQINNNNNNCTRSTRMSVHTCRYTNKNAERRAMFHDVPKTTTTAANGANYCIMSIPPLLRHYHSRYNNVM